MKKCAIFLIKIYQNTLSPFIGKNCRFTPTCSEYTIEAINEYGVIKGCIMGFKRICRCNPWSKGGYDPVRKIK
ncbi:MAG: membrane protein insertion efficiency factor YidD [Clostridia bacterium]|nr:membrane protein insertion efficiency factor YidD [Clostridia bacterium]